MLLDSDIMVDVLRGHAPAVAWLTTIGTTRIGLPGLVAMELLAGCRNSTEQKTLEARLAAFTLFWPTATDCQRAFEDFADFRLSQNLGILDALIGQTAWEWERRWQRST
jgi:predicted nucleic acid-binding protein